MRCCPARPDPAAAAQLAAQTTAFRGRRGGHHHRGRRRRRIGIIADDSMMGRDTPSRGLELTAKYVADQFRASASSPAARTAGSSATPSPGAGWIRPASRVVLQAGGGPTPRASTARPASSRAACRGSRCAGPAVLVGGAVTPPSRLGDAAPGQGRALRARLLQADPRQRDPGHPRAPAGSPRRSW